MNLRILIVVVEGVETVDAWISADWSPIRGWQTLNRDAAPLKGAIWGRSLQPNDSLEDLVMFDLRKALG